MIRKIVFRFGSTPTQDPVSVELKPITIFVGPNNSGKSLVLAEIEKYCRKRAPNPTNLLIQRIEFTPYTEEEIRSEISNFTTPVRYGVPRIPDCISLSKFNPLPNTPLHVSINYDSLVNGSQHFREMTTDAFIDYLSLHTIKLDGYNRLDLLNEQGCGNLLGPPFNLLTYLFVNNDIRSRISIITQEAFSKFFVVDPTNMGKLRVRLSNRAPVDEQEEKSWNQNSIDFHQNSIEISNAGDGVRAFLGIITTILTGDPKVTLIDEPEAFLHPALANKLGKEISNAVIGSKKNLFVSTHSASFLMGCIQSGVPLDIIRLTYTSDVPTVRVLPQEKILPLMRNPLLRSTGILNGLFYESVVVTEGDSDRAFYQEINERLLDAKDPRGISNCLFINAQNKQTIWDIVKPLRELGIPALGIVDLDVLKEGGQVWSKPLEGAFIPELNHSALQAQRRSILDALLATGRNMKREGGISLLSGQEREGCENLLTEKLHQVGNTV